MLESVDSLLKPFHQTRPSHKDGSSHPDFLVAVTRADEYYAQPYTLTGSNEEDAGCHVEDMPHEEAESNEVESAKTPDREVDQVPVEVDDAKTPDAEVNQVPVEVEDAETPDGEANQVPVEVEDAETPDGEPVEVEEESGSGSSDKRDDPQFTQFQADELKEVPEIEIPAKKGKDDVETSERTKASDASGLKKLYVSGEKFVLDLEILPTKRLISYDDTTKMLLFQDGAAVSIDAESLGKEFNKSFTGRTLHECIHELGRKIVREQFPRSARSSVGLKFGALDPRHSFAQRLRDTWVREYKSEPMPDLLRSRFVAGCLLEERGEPVNWASELTRTIRGELKLIFAKERESLSPGVIKLIVQLLEKQVGQAPLPVLKAVKGEEPMDSTKYDSYCQQCNNSGGELL